MESYKITSESVTEGHPDKICDQISDAILDAYLTINPSAHVAVECMISRRLLVIAGEVRSPVSIDMEKIARQKLRDIGYHNDEIGIDAANCAIVVNVNQQSEDIQQGVLKEEPTSIGAGDQGIVYGYACMETEDFMPLPIVLAHRLTQRLSEVRKNQELSYLLPDGKAQVTVEYSREGQPLRVTDIVVSAQHQSDVSQQQLSNDIKEKVIFHVIKQEKMSRDVRIWINPTGRFVIGGPKADCGLTGRKIIVDTYGGVIPHGGGAFSGKDSTKLDRSGAYMARYAAKNIVAAGLAEKCQISVSYAIGVAEPVAFFIDTFGTEKIPVDYLYATLNHVFDFTPYGISTSLDLRKPIFSKSSCYGHFKSGYELTWEKLDQVAILKEIKMAAKNS